jgi:hypothetical protein
MIRSAICEECDEAEGWHAEGCPRALSEDDRALLQEKPDTTLARFGPEREQVAGPRLEATTTFLAEYYEWTASSEGRFAQYYARHERQA